MLKAADYFCFIPAISIAGGAFGIFNLLKARLPLPRMVWVAACAIVFVPYAGYAYQNKLSLLARYRQNVRQAPALSAYYLPPEPQAAAVLPDLDGNALDLFIYCNRWRNTQIIFPTEDSARFAPAASGTLPVDYVFRLAAPPVAGEYFTDINRPVAEAEPLSRLAPNRGCVRLSTQAGSSPPPWSAVMGDSKAYSRWLTADVGPFRVYRPPGGMGGPIHLNVSLAAGPDARPENSVRIVIDNQLIGEILPKDMHAAQIHRFPLPAFVPAWVEGFLQIKGPRGGAHRVSVSRLFTD